MCQHYREVTHTRDTYTGTEDVAMASYVYRHSLRMHTGKVAKHQDIECTLTRMYGLPQIGKLFTIPVHNFKHALYDVKLASSPAYE